MGNKKITTKLSRLKSVSGTDDYYLEAATGAILKNFVIFTGNTCAGVQQFICFRMSLYNYKEKLIFR